MTNKTNDKKIKHSLSFLTVVYKKKVQANLYHAVIPENYNRKLSFQSIKYVID